MEKVETNRFFEFLLNVQQTHLHVCQCRDGKLNKSIFVVQIIANMNTR